jgi:hypothetical protein
MLPLKRFRYATPPTMIDHQVRVTGKQFVGSLPGNDDSIPSRLDGLIQQKLCRQVSIHTPSLTVSNGICQRVEQDLATPIDVQPIDTKTTGNLFRKALLVVAIRSGKRNSERVAD